MKLYAIILVMPKTIILLKKAYKSLKYDQMTNEERINTAINHIVYLLFDFARAVFAMTLISTTTLTF